MFTKVMACLCSVLLLVGGTSARAFAADQTDPLNWTVNKYLASCSNNSKKGSDCEGVITILNLYSSFHPETGICMPEIPEDFKEMDALGQQETMSVIGWLRDHPVPQDWDANRAVGAALRSLYPCQR